jgi:hypothetical protein
MENRSVWRQQEKKITKLVFWVLATRTGQQNKLEGDRHEQRFREHFWLLWPSVSETTPWVVSEKDVLSWF